MTIKLHEQIAFLRKQRGLTQTELAEALGVTNQAVSKWESGQCCPDISLLPEIADFFGVTVDLLLGKEETPVNSPDELLLQLRGTVKDLPKGKDLQFILQLAYTLHALVVAKNIDEHSIPGFDTEHILRQAKTGKWGLTCIDLPEIMTYMRKGTVLFSDNSDPGLSGSRIRDIARKMGTFSDIHNLKILLTLHALTVHAEDAHVSAGEIAAKSGLSEDTVRECLANNIDEYLHRQPGEIGDLWRIDGMYMHLVPLLALFTDIG